eukprot:NODE_7622_length_557_cov_6.309055_g6594_i0.p1 GENE.NODE_7622_length_557_cov_6.309055_g6594_i0~~NODE_7622_length_557_cov_6.309055_g6594_i0.p1  ORF type:complete len:56 (+),score=2.86 NODE_7622_length_557_cov_6.309055_g6594_i0:238-405(+)
MDWRFGVTSATSESDEDGSTFLQLKLSLDKVADLLVRFSPVSLPSVLPSFRVVVN